MRQNFQDNLWQYCNDESTSVQTTWILKENRRSWTIQLAAEFMFYWYIWKKKTNTCSVVLNIVNSKLKLNLRAADFDTSHRVVKENVHTAIILNGLVNVLYVLIFFAFLSYPLYSLLFFLYLLFTSSLIRTCFSRQWWFSIRVALAKLHPHWRTRYKLFKTLYIYKNYKTVKFV